MQMTSNRLTCQTRTPHSVSTTRRFATVLTPHSDFHFVRHNLAIRQKSFANAANAGTKEANFVVEFTAVKRIYGQICMRGEGFGIRCQICVAVCVDATVKCIPDLMGFDSIQHAAR